MEDYEYVIGTMPFTICCSRRGRSVRFRISVETERGTWIDALRGGHAQGDVADILGILSERWPEIAGPYAGHASPSAILDLSLLAGIADPAPVVMERHGAEIGFVTDGRRYPMYSDSVIVIECFLAFGNTLAVDAGHESAERWREVSSPTMLPPFRREHRSLMEPVEGDREAETDWYALALGQDPGDYRRAARWLSARQMAFAGGKPGCLEPTREDYDVRSLPRGLPGDDEVRHLLEEASALVGMPADEIAEHGISLRDFDARQTTVFRRFFPLP